MTFDNLVAEVKDRLNLSSTEATTRIGKAINRKYRLVTTSIGMEMSRRAVATINATLGVSLITVPNCEKIMRVVKTSTTPYKVIPELTLHEMTDGHQPFAASDNASAWALYSHTSNSVTILINCIPQTAFSLTFEYDQVVPDLSGTNEPAFPESFHEILVEGVMGDELRKMEKPQLAQMCQMEYERILSDLRMWIAKSGYLDIYQGKTAQTTFGTGSMGGGGGTGTINGALSYSQTGLLTFSRGASAPFAVVSGAAKVANLDADLLDGLNSTAFQTAVFQATVTGAVNDWNPGTGIVSDTLIEWAGAGADAAITGIAGGAVGRIVTVRNNGTFVMSFAHNSGSSLSANRLQNPITSGLTRIAPGGFITYQYSGGEWCIVSHEQGNWITLPYAAGNFTATTGTWTVADVDELVKYYTSGRSLFTAFQINNTTVSNVTSELKLTMPFTFASGSMFQLVRVKDDVTAPVAGMSIGNPGTSAIYFYATIPGGGWAVTTGANRTFVQGYNIAEVT